MHHLYEGLSCRGGTYTSVLRFASIVGVFYWVGAQQGYPLNYPLWRAHHYDWIKFGKYAVGAYIGATIAGTLLFGNPTFAIGRIVNFYTRNTKAIDANGNQWDDNFLPNLQTKL